MHSNCAVLKTLLYFYIIFSKKLMKLHEYILSNLFSSTYYVCNCTTQFHLTFTTTKVTSTCSLIFQIRASNKTYLSIIFPCLRCACEKLPQN